MVYLENVWSVTKELAPWLLLGVVIAGVLHVFMPADFIRRHLGRKRFSNVLKACLFGVPMPLCSCGVIPAGAGLKRDGASNGATIGFLISTPQTGVDSFAVSGALLSWPFALFKVLAAFVTGLIGGVLMNAAEADGEPPAHGAAQATPPFDRNESMAARVKEVFSYGFLDLLRGIWLWIAVGIAVSALISTFLPTGSLAGHAWSEGIGGMLAMLVISTPLYVCATGSVPIAGALVQAGLSPGTALVFLMAGPATNAATFGAVLQILGRRALAIYLPVIVIGSMAFGLLFDWALDVESMTGGMAHALPHIVHSGSAVILLALLAAFAVSDVRNKMMNGAKKEATVKASDEETVVLCVEDMSCQHCVRTVAGALRSLSEVSDAVVDLESGTATVSGKGLDAEKMIRTLDQAGYPATTRT